MPRSWPLWAGALGLSIVALVAWQFTPLRDRITGRGLLDLIEAVRAAPHTWLAVIGAFAAGALTFVPITVLVVLTAAIFPTWSGAALIAAGTAVNATTGYLAGLLVGRQMIRRLFPAPYGAMERQLRGVGAWKLFVIRFFPVTPFATMNVVCGAVRLAFGPYIVAAVASVLPGAVLLTVMQSVAGGLTGSGAGRALGLAGGALMALFTVPFLVKYAARKLRRSRHVRGTAKRRTL